MKVTVLVSLVVLLSACAGHERREERREDRRSELQTTQPASMLGAAQVALPVRPG